MTGMTEEQKELFDKLTPLQQKVCTNIVSGMSDIDSYEKGGGKANSKESARASVSRMLTDVNVSSFLNSMKHQAVNSAIMSREEMMERLSNLSRVNMSDLISWHITRSTSDDGEEVEQTLWSIKESAEQDPYAMASIAEVTAGKEGFKVKQHSPLAAMAQLAKLAGYDAPQQIESTVTQVNYSSEEYKKAIESLDSDLKSRR
ncbi:terminase small subunit [Vibrio phage 1.029.O._10N.261.55.A7]|nr:terminase small subunit [Vibrio phage 1.029.O._10N.261.55.A7]